MKPTIEQRLQALRILWLAQFGSVAIFAVVCFTISHGPDGPDFEVLPTLRPILWMVGVALALLSLWWRRSFAVSPSNRSSLFGGEPNGATLSQQAAAAALARLQTNCIIVWAMSEAVALCGLVLAVLTHNVSEFLPFAVAAVFLLYTHRLAAWPLDRILRGAGRGGMNP